MKRKAKKRKARAAIVPAHSDLRLGSLPVANGDALMRQAQRVAESLAKILPEKGLTTELVSKNPNIAPKKYVKADGWTICGAMLGVNPIEESCERVEGINGYKAIVRLERVCDSKVVGRASAICSLNEPASTEVTNEEFATYSKTITRATGKAFRLTYGWIMKLGGFEGTPAEELYEVEGSSESSEEIAKRKIEQKLGKQFETLAHAEAALIEQKQVQKEEKARARKSVFITWPEAHHGHRFLLMGRLLIWENGLTYEVTDVCGGVFSDRDGGWYINANHAPYLREKIKGKGIQLIESPVPGVASAS